MQKIKSHKTFEGHTTFWSHSSRETQSVMKFSTFIPAGGKVRGCILWLSGLTCTDENFIMKAGAQRYLAQKQLMVLAPDTSPRGLNLPGEQESFDFGVGAGFYVDALVAPYSAHYRMFSYVAHELYEIILEYFKVPAVSIMGHSMGGHGALVLGLRFPQLFRAVSAFAPIVNPVNTPLARKAFAGYLGEDQQQLWKTYDACELLHSGARFPGKILVHQGTEDEFLQRDLQTEKLLQAVSASAKSNGGEEQALEIKYCTGYDHSYYFVSSFIEEHINYHSAQFD